MDNKSAIASTASPPEPDLKLKRLGVTCLPVFLLVELDREVSDTQQGGAVKTEQDCHRLLHDRESVDL